MRDICRVDYATDRNDVPSTEKPPTLRKELYEKLLGEGILAKMPEGTRIEVLEMAGFGVGGVLSGLAHFKLEYETWKGRDAWTCPGSVVLFHAYP